MRHKFWLSSEAPRNLFLSRKTVNHAFINEVFAEVTDIYVFGLSHNNRMSWPQQTDCWMTTKEKYIWNTLPSDGMVFATVAGLPACLQRYAIAKPMLFFQIEFIDTLCITA